MTGPVIAGPAMRAPEFWQRPAGWQAALLAPLAALWRIGAARRLARPPQYRAPVPVICIGNLVAGGTGKTPLTIAVAEMLRGRGIAAHTLSRGYGGRAEGPLAVDLARHSADDVGDEPLLLAAFGPAWIARDRAAGAAQMVAAGAEAIVMDDGFQNPDLAKSLSIIAIDAHSGFGNGRLIPAGPLREPIATGLARADLLVLIGDTAARAKFRTNLAHSYLTHRHDDPPAPPIVEAEIRPLMTGMDWHGLRALAFAGIGRPEKFFASLRALGADLASTHAFADHAPYPAALCQRLEREAARLGAQLVTTEKDAVRLPPAMRRKVLTLPVRLALVDAAPLEAALSELFAR